MKNILNICLVISISCLMLQSFAGEPQKNGKKADPQPKADSVRTEKTVKKSTPVQSGWLNSKNFPQLRPSPCPFFVQPGC